MKTRFEDELTRWLNAERDGDEEAAERAFARAVRHLDRQGPAAGFADSVLGRAGVFLPQPQGWRWWWAAAGAIACLLGAGVAAAGLPWLLLLFAPASRVFVWFVPAALHWTGRWAEFAGWSWTVIAKLSVALRAVLGTSDIQTVLLANALVATISLLGLTRLLRAPEELTEC